MFTNVFLKGLKKSDDIASSSGIGAKRKENGSVADVSPKKMKGEWYAEQIHDSYSLYSNFC